MTCITFAAKIPRISALDNMGTTLNRRTMVLQRLRRLTPREREVCILHFIEGRSQTLIAEWLDITLRTVQEHIQNAVTKVPHLEPLRVKSLEKPKRPKIILFRDLRKVDRSPGPFNPDEI